MTSSLAFVVPFNTTPPLSRTTNQPGHVTVRRERSICCQTPQAYSELPMLYTRRTFMSSFGALFGLSAAAHLERVGATQVTESLEAFETIRKRVNDIDGLITNAKWDSVRTVLATPPLTNAKDACSQLLKDYPEDMTGAIVGLREDLFSAIRLLDTSVYSNVFVGEDRQVLGTKVDYDVPRVYLSDLKETLDALIDLARN